MNFVILELKKTTFHVASNCVQRANHCSEIIGVRSRFFPSILLAWFVLCLASPVVAADPSNLLSNGDFEAGSSDSPTDWPTPAGVSWQEDEGNHYLHVEADPARMITVYREFPLRTQHTALRLSFRVRVNKLERGKANWHDGRIILDFKDAQGTKLKGGSHPSFHGSTNGWVEKTVELLVPPGATKLEVMPAMFQAQSGSYDLDDVQLTSVDPAPLIAKREADEAKRQQEIARRAALVKPQVPRALPSELPAILHVAGNKILDASDREVWLQGVSLPSMEWSAGGENILKSIRVAIDDWHANTIRLCIRENFWAGTGPYQSDGGAGYRQLVDDVVNLASANGVYVVLDLHRFRAPEPQHVTFWKELAELYKNHPAVLFELFNEPHDVSWKVWRDGGFVSTQKQSEPNTIAENKDQLKGFESVGMQALLDAVRQTGANNIVIVGGLDWSYDLSGVLTGFAVEDRNGNGIVYSTHIYPWKSDWQKKFIDVAKLHPIFIGECGATQERLDFIPPSQHEDPSTWVPDFLGLVQKNRYHWTAWSFHPKASPCLLNDWNYSPTPYWGVHAKAALSGTPFESEKLR
jgi:hypothetical protein